MSEKMELQQLYMIVVHTGGHRFQKGMFAETKLYALTTVWSLIPVEIVRKRLLSI
jgi:hypothetical protein